MTESVKRGRKAGQDPLDHDGDGRKGGSLPKAEPAGVMTPELEDAVRAIVQDEIRRRVFSSALRGPEER